MRAMNSGFEIIDGITSADIAIRAYAGDCNGMFIAACRALRSLLMDNPDDISREKHITFTLRNSQLDLLLVEYLQEFIYYKDAHGSIFVPDNVDITCKDNCFTLTCSAYGEPIDRGKHIFGTDIKAVTLHRLGITRSGDRWSAVVVFDV